MNMSLRSNNMRRYLYIFCGLLTLLASCQKSGYDMSQGQPIYLSVSLDSDPLTKTPFEGDAPTTSNPLNVAVWASTTAKSYVNNGWDGSAAVEHKVAIHTQGRFQSGAPQLLSQAIYPPPRQGASGSYTADPVYFVAMHPQDSWSTTNGAQASFTFKGCEDVMFAPEVFGAYDTKEQTQVVNDSPVLAFEHLLTRITVKMGIVLAEGENLQDVQEAWGKITDLKIQTYHMDGYGINLNKVTIDLSQGADFSYDTDLAFSGQQDSSMDFYTLGTDNKFPSENGYLLTEKIDSVAYVMCAPVIATAEDHEYVIIVETENRGVQELKLDLQKTATSADGTGSTRGNHFLATLKFKKGRAIAMEAIVTEWKNGGFGIGDIED